MSTSLCQGNQSAKDICISAVIQYPPMIPAVIFANCCWGDLLKYFGFAGINKGILLWNIKQ